MNIRIKWLLRVSFLALVGVLVAMPVAKVYTTTSPMIERLEVRFNDLTGVTGHGVPGSLVQVWYRQRNFKEGVRDYPDDPFRWCKWKNNGNAVMLGQASVDVYGKWRIGNLDLQVHPSISGGGKCGGGLRTDFHVGAYNNPVPEIRWLNVGKPGNQRARISGKIRYANQVSAGIADGPNDGGDPRFAEYPIDVDEDGADLCNTPGHFCGKTVSWKNNGGTFQSPSIQLIDATPVMGRDPEFTYLQGMIQGHKPGGSVLAVSQLDRPNPGLAVTVNLNINGLDDICSGGLFDFLEGMI